jgi:hypothetical protein
MEANNYHSITLVPAKLKVLEKKKELHNWYHSLINRKFSAISSLVLENIYLQKMQQL